MNSIIGEEKSNAISDAFLQADKKGNTKGKKPKKAIKVFSIILAIIIACSGAVGGVYWYFSSKQVQYTSDDNYFSYESEFSDVKITDEKSAIQAIDSVSSDVGIKNAESELKLVNKDSLGTTTFYRFQQLYKNIPVFGRNIIISADESGTVSALTANSSLIEDVNTKPKLSKDKAIEIVNKNYDGITKTFYNDTVIFNINGAIPQLAHFIVVSGASENNDYYEQCIVSDDSGKVLLKNSLLNYDKKYPSKDYTYSVDDKTKLMYDSNRNIIMLNSKRKKSNLADYCDERGVIKPIIYDSNAKGTLTKTSDSYGIDEENFEVYLPIEYEKSESSKWNKKASSIMENCEITYDFYNEILNRKGYDNKNTILHVAYNDSFFESGNNACSRGKLICFGYNFNNSINTVAHEYTHSVEKTISGMIGNGESGALMEAYSDIISELVEAYIDTDKKCDWVHNDRNISNPYKSKNPSEYEGKKWIDPHSSIDDGGEHNNSTVISHAAYLMYNGINGIDEMKLNYEQLAKLWYRSLFLLSPDATFNQCANAVIISGKQLIADGVLTAQQLDCVKQAFAKVKISSQISDFNSVTNGTVINVLDKNEHLYNNYHLAIKKIEYQADNSCKITDEVVYEADISNENGYVVNLDEGIYGVVVKDLKEEGSKYEYSTIIRVIDETSEYFKQRFKKDATRIANSVVKTLKKVKVNIYTDYLGDDSYILPSNYFEYYGSTYFRQYEADSVAEGCLFNNTSYYAKGSTKIMKRDEDGTVTHLFMDEGKGPFIIFNDRFYFSDHNKLYSVDMKGKNRKNISDSASLCAIERNNEIIVCSSELISIKTNEKTSYSGSFVSASEDVFLYTVSNEGFNASANKTLYCKNISENTTTKLASLHDDKSPGHYGFDTVQYAQKHCNLIYFSYGKYDGTARAYDGGPIYKVELDGSGLEIVVDSALPEFVVTGDVNQPILYCVGRDLAEDGCVKYNLKDKTIEKAGCDRIARQGDVFECNNNFCYFDKDKIYYVLNVSELKALGYTTETLSCCFKEKDVSVGTVEIENGCLYFTVVEGEYEKEKDYGWRPYYKRVDAKTYVKDLKTSKITLLYDENR